MTPRKKLIEVALPLEAINVASAREKSIRHGHPSTLHLWWARRPLAAARAVIFTSLVDDPGHHPEDHDEPVNAPATFIEACQALPKGKNATGVDEKGRSNDTPRMRLFDFIERLVTWEATTDEEILTTARELIRLSTDGNPPPLLDPFAGGGSIPLEAQRLGLEAHASDLNPVAVMINKALIEIPPKFANQPPVNPRDRAKVGGKSGWKGASGLAADVRYYGEWMREKAWERIGHLYPTYGAPASSRQEADKDVGAPGETVIAWLWARTVQCPNPACGAQMPLVRSFDLSKKKGKRAWVEPQVDQKTRKISFEVKKASKGNGPEGTVNRQGAVCLACKTAVPLDHIREEGRSGRMGAQLLAVVSEGNNGRNYHRPTPEHDAIAQVIIPDSVPDTDLPEQALGFRVQLYGMTKHRDLFTPRQLVALITFSDLVADAREQMLTDALAAGQPADPTPLRDGGTGTTAYAEAVSVYLTFILDRVTDKSSSLAWWMNTAEKMAPTFSRHALPMVWDYAEMNPFCNVTSNFAASVEWVGKVIDYLPQTPDKGEVLQSDARHVNLESALISTDPPYYDNIGYADLSDYMYIWMRRALRNIFPNIMGTMLVPKDPELIASPFRHGGNSSKAQAYFEAGLLDVFTRLRVFTNNDYPLSIYYAFKQQEILIQEGTASTGWETILEALMVSGFEITGTWPVRTERSGGLRNLNQNALASSIVLVCRPRPENAPLTSRREFVNTLRQELPTALREMQSGNIAPVDLAQASIGPGMAVYSRYSQVLEANGDRLTVRAALQLINQVLDEYLAEVEGDLDGDSRFAVSWFEQFGFNAGEFGVADVLARAKNTSVEGLVQAGVIESGMGKVRLLTWEELDPGWDPSADKRPTVWEATHHLIERINIHGEEGAALLLSKMSPELAANGRQLAYRLYAICERKGWAEYGRDYNALVISWSSSQERAAEVKQSYQQKGLFG